MDSHEAASAGGGGSAVGLTIGLIAAFVGVLVIVAIVVVVILLTMSNQLVNVFSNDLHSLGDNKERPKRK